MLAQLIESAREAYRRGAWDEALAGYETALAMVPEEGEASSRADLLRLIGTVYRDRGELELAWQNYAASRALAEEAGLNDRLASVLNAQGIIEMRRGNRQAAAELYLRARELAEGRGDDRLAAMIDQNLGILANIQGNVAVALLSYRSALERYRRLGDRETASGALTNMGMAHVDLGEWEAAEQCFDEAAALAAEVGDAMKGGLVELNRTELYLRRRRHEAARESCGRALAVFQRLRSKQSIAEAYKYYGVLYRETGNPGLADTHFALALGLAENAGDRLLQAETQMEWALLQLEEEQRQEGILRLNRALAIFRELQAGREVLDVESRLRRLRDLYLPAVKAWGAGNAEGRDPYQAGHAQRVAEYSARLAREVGLGEAEETWVRVGALLHDIGNSAIPAHMLGKADALSADERQLVRVHTLMGDSMAAHLDFPAEVRPIVRNHHEHWSGAGYPDGLKGDEIPLGARIVSVADVFDALTSPRAFRPAYSPGEALRLMEEEAGERLDPALFGVFRQMLDAGAFGSDAQ
jgi:putative nucleotidyltransferase with HDIG domain